MKVPFFDLKIQYESIKDEIEASISEIFNSQHFILGKYVSEFEKKLADFCSCKYAVAVSSGTDAILAALMAIDIKPDDEVILPDFTFFATAGTVARLGAIPVFVDILPTTYNIDPAEVRKKITNKTKAIMPVHLFGRCANMRELKAISEEFNIPIIEDACQAIGASCPTGKKAGSMGLMGCFSFYPTKNLGGAGDSGAITTNDEKLYEKLKQMRNHGMEPRYCHKFVGGNFRMDELQAAVLVNKLPNLDSWNGIRRLNAMLYRKHFINNELVEIDTNEFTEKNKVIIPYFFEEDREDTHIFHQYCIRVKKRDELKQFLADNGIGTDIYYPIPLHRQECFSYLNSNDADFPITNQVCEEIIALPIYPEVEEASIQYITQKIKEFYQ